MNTQSPLLVVIAGAAAGLAIGIVGPILFDMPQGPLLALFTTPIGAAIGTGWAVFRR